jgi:hypothetical protein
MIPKIKNVNLCPKAVRLGYERARRLKHSKEPTSESNEINYDTMAIQPDEETTELVDLVGTIFATYDAAFEECSQLDFGKDHNWSKKSVKVRHVFKY